MTDNGSNTDRIDEKGPSLPADAAERLAGGLVPVKALKPLAGQLGLLAGFDEAREGEAESKSERRDRRAGQSFLF
jgi:hypothetical protein